MSDEVNTHAQLLGHSEVDMVPLIPVGLRECLSIASYFIE